MPARDPAIEHLLRRAGFGSTEAELSAYLPLGYRGTLERLLNFEQVPDDVDEKIGQSGYVSVTARGEFSPATVINDARQRWLFRMIHSARPLQEKMTLFWHNHFATAYSKVQGAFGGNYGTQLMAAKPSEHPGQIPGQIELLRQMALGNFRDLLVAVTKDPAMLVWLDGRTNVRNRPQENYARELMELFTMGVGFYTEADVYAGARVFTGWNLRTVGPRNDPSTYYEFAYLANQHDTAPKEFSFAIYPDGGRTIPARAASDGTQDGLDLIDACVRHPETPRRLARLMWGFFISELAPPDPAFIEGFVNAYYGNAYELRPLVRFVLSSPQFLDSANAFTRYSWPAEFVVRAIKQVGWNGYSVNDALTPLVNMGQQLFEPPDVAGWALGQAWFSTGSMLSRMNYAASLTSNQRFNIRDATRPFGRAPSSVLSYWLDRLHGNYDRDALAALSDYLTASGSWTGDDAQLLAKSAGLAHLMLGSAEYQFV